MENNKNQEFEPVQGHERMHTMDMLRGFALLGIFIANVYYLSLIGFMGKDQIAAFPFATLDHYTHFIMVFLIEGKFYSIFSLLFGAGFGLLLIRAKQKGIPFKKYYSRRLLILLGVGMVHLFIIWAGDILTLYASMGFFLIFFVDAEEKTLWKWAIALLLSPIMIYGFIYFSGGLNPGIPFFLAMRWLEGQLFPMVESVDIYHILKSGNLLETLKVNIVNGFARCGDLLYSSRLPKVLGMFLLGFIFIKRNIFSNPAEHHRFLRKACLFGFSLGLPFSLATAIIGESGSIYNLSNSLGLWHTISYAIGVHSLAIGYIAGILLLAAKKNTFFLMFAPAGRMALTNYLMQTAFGIFIFYGIGLGFGGNMGYTAAVLVAVAIFVVQVLYSHIWLSYFYYGPAEWAWRSLLLKKQQKFRIHTLKQPA